MSDYGLGKDIARMQDQLLRIETTVNQILTLQGAMMATITELNTKVDELEQALETEHQQIMDALAELRQANEDLAQLVVDGGTHEERVALSGRIDTVITNLSNIIEDDEGEDPGNGGTDPVDPEPEPDPVDPFEP